MYQILINNQPLRPTEGSPYVFESYKDAFNTLCLFYGADAINKFAKIVKI